MLNKKVKEGTDEVIMDVHLYSMAVSVEFRSRLYHRGTLSGRLMRIEKIIGNKVFSQSTHDNTFASHCVLFS